MFKMTDKKKKVVCVACAVALALGLFAVPALAIAGTSPEDEILQEYDIQGYDSEGNAILSNEDYESYMNQMLEKLAEEKQKKK